MEPAPGDPNEAALRGILDDLRAARPGGRKLEVVAVPSPGEVRDRAGNLLPASYMNFYIGNAAVVVPLYGAAKDGAAIETIQQLFPDRKVVGLRAYHVLTGGGSFHCISQQLPA